MRPTTRPLARQLWWLVLASLVPAAWVAAAFAASVYEPTGANALVLVMGVMALIAGAAASILMARGLSRALDDLAAEAELLSRERPLSRLQPAVREFARIADGLAAAGVRLQQAPARRAAADALCDHAEAALAVAHAVALRGEWRWDLATGAMSWSAAVDLLFHLARDGASSRTRLLALAHRSGRAALVAWLARLARGEEAAPFEFCIIRGDGATRAIRATAAVERDPSGAAVAIAGTFEDLGDGNPAESSPPAPGDAWSADATSLLQTIAAKMRQRAHAAGIDFGAAIMPDLGPLGGDVGAIAAALSGLAENALTVTARGGRILLRANRAADGALRIALGPAGLAASDGLEMAGHMIELNCGALAAKRIEEARTLLAANGGRLAIKRVPGQGDAVTIVLPSAEAQRKAA